MYNIAGKTLSVIQSTHWSAKILAMILATFAPLKDYVYFLIFLLVVDAITSIYYQFKKNVEADKKPSVFKKFSILFHTVESNKLRTTFEKMVLYVLGMCVCFLFDKIALQIIPLEGNPLTYFSLANICTVLICAVEVYSILENISKITHNPIWSKLAKIFKKKIDGKIDEL